MDGAMGTAEGGGPHMEARVAKLEAGVEHIQADITSIRTDIGGLRGEIGDLRKLVDANFKLTFGALIAVALGLAGLMAKGFHWL